MTERLPSILSIRVLSFLAFVAWVSVIPLAKSGRTGAASSAATAGLLLTTGLFLEWVKKSSFNSGGLVLRRSLLALLVLLSGLYLIVLSAALFGLPAQFTKASRYVVAKLFFLFNQAQLLLGLGDLMLPRSWTIIVGALSCVLVLTFLLWIIRLRINIPMLLVFCALSLFGMILGLLAPSSEFQISSSAASAQMAFHVASAPAGNFVVAWQTKDKDADDWELYARRYGADGIPQSGEFQLNTYSPENQFVPRIAVDNSGNFAIAWESKGQDGSAYGVYCRRYNSEGVPQGEEFQVNTTTVGVQNDPSIAMAANGNFVVVWASDDASLVGIFGQRFDAAGNRVGDEFQVNTFTAGNQKKAFISSDPIGNFAVVWESDEQDGSGKDVFVRRFDVEGVPLGDEFRTNTYSTDDQFDTWINVNSRGEFVVVWSSQGQDGSGLGVHGRRFNASGDALGDEFRINTFTAGDQEQPSVSSDVNGNFLVVWESEAEDGSGKGVYGRRYNSTGEALGDEFQVNVYSTNDQFGPSVTYNSPDKFVVVWTSFGQDGYTEGVYGRIF